MHRLILSVLLCFTIISCTRPSHRIKHEFEKSGETITCFEPPPDVVTTKNNATFEAQVKEVTDLLKGSASLEQTYQRIRTEVPNLQAVETILFRLCVNYANGVLSAREYANSQKVLRLLDKSLQATTPSKEARIQEKKSKPQKEKILSKPPNPKISSKMVDPPVSDRTTAEEITTSNKNRLPIELKPLYSEAWKTYGENNRGVRVEQHGTSIKLSFSGKGNGAKNVAYFQTVPVENFKKLAFMTKLNISDDEGIGVPAVKLEFLDDSGRELFHIAMTPNDFYRSSGLFKRYPIEYGNNVTVKIRPKDVVKDLVSSESLSNVRQLRVSYEISAPEMFRCRRCTIEVFEAHLKSE